MFQGKVQSGRGIASQHIGEAGDELEIILGQRPLPGTLNVLLDRPLALSKRTGLAFDGGLRTVWPVQLNGKPVWLYRWANCPLHVAEFLSPDHIRSELNLSDGSNVTVEVDQELMDTPPLIAWTILWKGREGWFRNARYEWFANRLAVRTGFGMERLNPLRAAKGIWQMIWRRPSQPYSFQRVDAPNDEQRLLNLLNYTKTSGASYSADGYPAGYHSIKIGGRTIRGQRDPVARLASVPIDFAGKSVLDLGSNQGGMLFALSDKLKWGVGVDYDTRMVNAANRIKRVNDVGNLDFYVFDLERERLDLIRDFLPESHVDVCFLLSVCMWIKNWREVIDFTSSISDVILFETNGTPTQQHEQIAYLRSACGVVEVLTEESADDPGQKDRMLILVQP